MGGEIALREARHFIEQAENRLLIAAVLCITGIQAAQGVALQLIPQPDQGEQCEHTKAIAVQRFHHAVVCEPGVVTHQIGAVLKQGTAGARYRNSGVLGLEQFGEFFQDEQIEIEDRTQHAGDFRQLALYLGVGSRSDLQGRTAALHCLKISGE